MLSSLSKYLKIELRELPQVLPSMRMGFLAFVCSITLVFFYAFARIGLSQLPIMSMLAILSCVWYLVFSPAILLRFTKGNSWLYTPSFLIFANLILLTLLGQFSAWSDFDFRLPLIILGVISLVVFVSFGIKILRFEILLFLVAGFLMGVILASQVWASGYLSPLFFERLALGQFQDDSLMHVTLSSMIQTYMIPTTGLMGTPYTPYHIGSHLLFSGFAGLVGVSPLDFYQLGYPVIFLTLFIYSIGGIMPSSSFRVILLSLCLMLSAVSLMIFPFAREVMWSSAVISESYNISILLGLLLIGLLKNPEGAFASPLEKGNTVLYTIVVPILIFLLVLVKVTTGLVIVCIFAYAFLRMEYYKVKKIWIFVFALLPSLIAGWWLGRGSSSSVGYWQLFAHLRNFVDPQEYGVFWYQRFFWLLLAMSAAISFSSWKNLWSGLRAREFILVELVIAACLAGALPGLNFGGIQGSEWYFLDVQRWFAVAVCLFYVPILLEKLKLWLKEVVVLVLFACFCGSFFLMIAKNFSNFLASNIEDRSLILTEPGCILAGNKIDRPQDSPNNVISYYKIIRESRNEVRACLEGSEKFQHFKKLMAFGESLKHKDRQNTLLFVPRSEKWYWNLESCSFATMRGPAVMRIALLDGLPDFQCAIKDTMFRLGFFRFNTYLDFDREGNAVGYRHEFKVNPCEKAFGENFGGILVYQKGIFKTLTSKDECKSFIGDFD